MRVSHWFPQNRRIKWWGSLDFGIQCPLGDLHLVAIACCDPRRTCEEEWSTLMFFCDYQGSKNLDELLSTVLSVSGEEWDNMLFQMDPNWVNCQSAAAEFWLTMITTGMYQCHPVAFFASKCLFYVGNHVHIFNLVRAWWQRRFRELGGGWQGTWEVATNTPLFWTSSLPYGGRSYSSCTMFVQVYRVWKNLAHNGLKAWSIFEYSVASVLDAPVALIGFVQVQYRVRDTTFIYINWWLLEHFGRTVHKCWFSYRFSCMEVS